MGGAITAVAAITMVGTGATTMVGGIITIGGGRGVHGGGGGFHGGGGGFHKAFSSAAGTLAEVGTMQGCAITMRGDATLNRVRGRNHSQPPHLNFAPLWNAGVVGQNPGKARGLR